MIRHAPGRRALGVHRLLPRRAWSFDLRSTRMARIRSIKPEFFTSEQIVECSTSARLLFVGLWCFCDDQGVHPASTRRLKMEVFPADSMSDDEVRAMVDELIRAKLVVEFAADGKRYFAVTGWQHQRIDRPTNRYPAPPKFDEYSTSTLGSLDDRSATEWRGEDRSGEDIRGTPPKTPLRETKQKTKSARMPPRKLPNAAAQSIPPILDNGAFRAAWSDWFTYRLESGKALTMTGAHRTMAAFESWGSARAIAAIENTILKGWQGIQEPTVAAANGQQLRQSVDPSLFIPSDQRGAP